MSLALLETVRLTTQAPSSSARPVDLYLYPVRILPKPVSQLIFHYVCKSSAYSALNSTSRCRGQLQLHSSRHETQTRWELWWGLAIVVLELASPPTQVLYQGAHH